MARGAAGARSCSPNLDEEKTTHPHSPRHLILLEQVVEIALAPGESAMCEPGSMCYTSNSKKETLFALVTAPLAPSVFS